MSGAGHWPIAKHHYRPARHVNVGYLGVVAIEPVKVIPKVGLETWELQELTLVACCQCVLKEVIVMQVIHFGYM